MFCPSCWVNLADGTARCPRCQRDLATAGPPVMPAVAGPPAPRPPPPRRSRLARINLGLGVAILGLMLGPPLVRWYEAPPSGHAPRPVSSPGVAATPRPSLDLPAPGGEPAPAPVAAGSAEATASEEALGLYRQGRVAEACERYREVAARASGEDARRNLGSCLARLGRDAYRAGQAPAAVQHYQRALEAHPEGREIWTALAIALVKAGDLSAAQSVIERALGRFSEDPETLYLLAEVQERQGRTREAVETLRRVLAAQPGHARARTLQASLEREQRVEGAYWAQESAHFLVRYEGAAGIDLGRSVVDTLEEAYSSIGRDLGTYPPDRIQVGIYTTQVLGEVIGVPAHYIRGAFDGRKLRLNLAESVAYSNDLGRLVRHEYTHAIIHLAASGRAPTWVHEGLAQVMEPRVAARSLEVSVPRPLLTLGGIERLSRTMDPVAFTAGYSLTHIAVEHLIERGGLTAMRDFLARLGRGESVPQALRSAYGFGPEEVESRLLAAAGKS